MPKKYYSFSNIVFATVILFVVALISIYLFKYEAKDIPQDTSVIMYVNNDVEGYEFVGYYLTHGKDGHLKICGATFLTATKTITSAHCVNHNSDAFIGENNINIDTSELIPINKSLIYNKWNGTDSLGDIAVILHNQYSRFSKDITYPTITDPKLGCNYIVIGYDLNSKKRVSADVCINEINKGLLTIGITDGAFCFGDSGSVVVEKGTNEIVGVISSIVKDSESEDICYLQNTAVAVNLVDSFEFILHGEATQNFSICGQGCEYNHCYEGLNCSDKSICETSSGDCIARTGEECSPNLGIKCEKSLTCIDGKCVDRQITQFVSTDESFKEEGNNFWSNMPLFIWLTTLVIGFVIVMNTLRGLDEKRKRIYFSSPRLK